tara:strand:+ start:14 stop:226 length:213 start_codon:yes stop_codon:yes gene_type:complete
MDELMNMLVSPDESSSQISDKIKDILFAKSAENIEAIRPNVASTIFDTTEAEVEDEIESDIDSTEVDDGE